MEYVAKSSIKLVAHRGYAAEYPENSMSAFVAAVECGGEYLEFDVQLSRDKVPVIIHDDNLQRTGSQNVNIMESSWQQLKGQTIGEVDRLGDKFSHETILNLADFSRWLAQHPSVKVFVEIKEESIHHFGNKAVLESVSLVLQPVKQQCFIISFDAAFLFYVKQHSTYPIGYVLTKYDTASQQIAEKMQPEILICNYKKIPDNDDVLWLGAWEWFLYEIYQPEVAEKWLNRGVSYIETMQFKPMLEAFSDAS